MMTDKTSAIEFIMKAIIIERDTSSLLFNDLPHDIMVGMTTD
ncbi:hypothetical protein SDC9_109586 [bioreactor metagenome]|uniref:Uncharacterized protein n=1 Tax=bioreactor metagenome TaxID=1076179 RepID=A0A645BB67_9ZZZZ